jgi:hypothetical protein
MYIMLESGYEYLIGSSQFSITALEKGDIRIVQAGMLGAMLYDVLFVCSTLSTVEATIKN